ncbi:TetR/AcrR family transcriptional regulator [Acidaminobacter sp. JC074]|uniref:TetR/AcrR family transcriptional regulator n=1 Tax=Acidaminobacter sp. JC074 TaxID=2530199 RepID=UPI001F0D8077|nr:TetR/AcrR family transcriptional regulator [Acidaminobacter sp. JC074]
MSKREENRQIRSQKMLDGAVAVFEKKSLESAKMTDIADAAGIGVASLYRYFKTKADIALQVGILYFEAVNETLSVILSKDISGIEKVEEMMRQYQNKDEASMRFIKFIEELDHYIEKLEEKPERLKDYEAAVYGQIPNFNQALTDGISDGTISETIDLRYTIDMLNHTLMSLKQKFSTRGHVVSLDTETAHDHEMALLINVFLSYLKNGL